MTNFDQELKEKLKQNMEFWDEEIDDINRNEIIDRAYKVDKDLIGILIDDKEIRETFFDKIKEYWIFNVNKFVDYIENIKVLSNSYTKFKNKIGLTIDGKYLNERGEVSLVWPFKDCVLEGGMTKEDQKRNEIFFNEILAKDEIDRLFDAKVLTNFKKYTAKGEEKVKDFNRDEKGTIKDNLIIKGNNLLALHSLKKEFAGRVKLIYIDPPYNTGGDSFVYNDSFNHSTWLTFMKNRLEVAKSLLSDEGSIFVQIDHNESHYLKLLLDNIFGRDNFRNEIVWKRKTSVASKNSIGNTHDIIFYYSKSNLHKYNPIFLGYSDEYIKKQFKKDKSGRLFRRHDVIASPGLGGNSPKYEYKGYTPKTRWLLSKEKIIEMDKKGNLGWTKGGVPYRKLYLDELSGQPLGDVWQDISNVGGKESNPLYGQKPEKLIKRIIEISTNESEIVLDFFGGSGTTASVCHKMARRYISIEQISSQMELKIKRLKNVIGKESSKGKLSPVIEEFDNSGISKSVNWKGGGEFIYCELLKYNEDAVDKIQNAKDTKSLLKIWGERCEHYFLNYDVEIKKFNDNKKDFEKLTLKQQKDTLVKMLNKNQLYVNLSEIEDSQFKVSKEDKELNKKFYGGK